MDSDDMGNLASALQPAAALETEASHTSAFGASLNVACHSQRKDQEGHREKASFSFHFYLESKRVWTSGREELSISG
jgi:hypothetical protein